MENLDRRGNDIDRQRNRQTEHGVRGAAAITDRPPFATQSADNERAITLGLLNAIQGDNQVTQRSVAKELGIALGLANAYLKRCVTKGYIKLSKVPPNRYAYYLTPRGFAEKSRLTAEFLSQSFQFFRDARGQYGEIMADCAARRWTRVAFCGSGDLAEIASLCTADIAVTVAGVVDGAGDGPIAANGKRVAEALATLGTFDAVVVTDLRNPQATFDALAETLPTERIMTPKMLDIARSKPDLAD